MSGISRWRRVCALLALASVSSLSHPSTPHLVLDLNTISEPLSSEPQALGRLGGVQLFQTTLSTPAVPRAGLVKSDGTAAGTVTLKTFDGKGPLIQPVMVIGSRAFFLADETAGGSQVWVTDGTPAGTQKITSFTNPVTVPATTPVAPRLLTAFGNDLLFVRRVGTGPAYQLYRTDGTATGTTLLGQMTPSDNTLIGFDVAVVGSRLYFVSYNNGTAELWVSDGTATGTQKIPTDGTLGANASIRQLRAVNGALVFVASNLAYGQEIARLDTGTNAISIVDLSAGGASGIASSTQLGVLPLPVLNGFVYFVGTQSSGDLELWRSDGTPGGTTRVKDIKAGAASGFDTLGLGGADIVRVGDRVIFVADDGSGKRLWSSDGTDAGTVAMLSSSVSFSWGLTGTYLSNITTTRYLYLPGYLGSTPVSVETDGTTASVLPLTIEGQKATLVRATGDATSEYLGFSTFNPTTSVSTYYAFKHTPPNPLTPVRSSTDPFGSSAFVNVGDKLLFDGLDESAGVELWVSDAAGSRQLVDLAPQSFNSDSNPQWFTDWNGSLTFTADDGSHGIELWMSDGTATGTKMLVDINPGAASSNPQFPYVWNGALYFFASDGTTRLMRLANPNATPEVLANADAPPYYSPGVAVGQEAFRCPLPKFVPMGGKLYFTAKTAASGTELWATDGTAAGTAMVADLSGSTLGSIPCGLTSYKNRLYFTADTSTSGLELTHLWSSDGTAAGTSMFASMQNPSSLVIFNDTLYFRTFDTPETWKTDGTPAGTVGLGNWGTPYGVVNGKLVLAKTTNTPPAPTTYDISITDGTQAGLVRLSDAITPPVLAGDRFYFKKAVSGNAEVWTSDGTAAGTRRVLGLGTDAATESFVTLDFRGVTLLMTTDPTGRSLWRTDGTEAGTTKIGTTVARASTGQGSGPVVSGQNVFYAGLDALTGNELYAFSNDAPAATADSATASGGQAVTVNVLTNDADGDGSLNAATVQVVQAPAHGATSVGANGNITYTPTAGYSGSDSFVYSVADNQGNVSNATVNLIVTAAPGSGGTAGGGGGSSSGSSGGGGPLRWFDVLVLAALAAWKLVRISRRTGVAWKILSPAVNNL